MAKKRTTSKKSPSKTPASRPKTVIVTKNEILTALNEPDKFILAVAIIDQNATDVRYCRTPFERETDFKATSVDYDLIKLLTQAQETA